MANALELHAVATLSALAAAAFGAHAPAGARGLALVAVGFLAGAVAFAPPRLPAPQAVAVAVALVAGFLLARPRTPLAAPLAGGLAAAAWAAALHARGLPYGPALVPAAALPLCAAWLAARRPAFAPAVLREEALLVVGALALVVATAGPVLRGWRSAAALTAEPVAKPPVAAGAWVAAFVLACLGGGGLYALWKRR